LHVVCHFIEQCVQVLCIFHKLITCVCICIVTVLDHVITSTSSDDKDLHREVRNMYEGRSINKLQNSVILLVFQI